jgi:anti-sigma regulatory factor (Ser/Thr protein kinase)
VSGPGAVLPGALPPAAFFGRVAELARLRREARSLARGAGTTRVLCARAGSGKTELLRQWHGRLFGEGEVLPLWFGLPRDCGDRARLAGELLARAALQALAFRRREPGLLARVLPARELAAGLRESWPEAAAPFAEALAGLADAPRDPLEPAALLPHRLAAATGAPVLCIVDDADALAAGAGWPAEAIASRLAPCVITVEHPALASGLLGAGSVSAACVEALGPLSVEALERLARQLARAGGLELAGEAVTALAEAAAGSPHYLGALVRALAERPGATPADVARAAAESACDGELARYWLERLAAAFPERRARSTALELLVFCLREGQGGADAGRLPALMLKPEAEVDAALAALRLAGMARVDCARVAVDADPVFRDVVSALYRREFGRTAPGFVAAELAAEKIRRAPEAARLRRREAFRGALRGLLEAWDGQEVPAVLFDAPAWRARIAPLAAEARAAALAEPAARIALPRVLSVAAGPVGGGVAAPGFACDALAFAQRPAADPGAPEAAVAWVARIVAGGGASAEQLERFDREVAALQGAGDLPAGRLVRWALPDAPLDAAGERCAARLRIATSEPAQLEALAAGVGAAGGFTLPEAAAPPRPALELEMVIPRADDVELVAARALEQLAENLDLDAAATGRLKMALVEACINAFEHGGDRDGRVRLVFSVAPGRLAVRVENRGRPLEALPPAAAPGREAGGRGWGLSLIRELVDEVSLEPREDGVSLLMVKRLEGGGA